MECSATVLQALGGEAGCKPLSAELYAPIGQAPVLRPLFPEKSHRCAVDAFGAFLIQFPGEEDQPSTDGGSVSMSPVPSKLRLRAPISREKQF